MTASRPFAEGFGDDAQRWEKRGAVVDLRSGTGCGGPVAGSDLSQVVKMDLNGFGDSRWMG